MLLWVYGSHSKAALHTTCPGYKKREKRPDVVMMSGTPALWRLKQKDLEFQAGSITRTCLRQGVRKRQEVGGKKKREGEKRTRVSLSNLGGHPVTQRPPTRLHDLRFLPSLCSASLGTNLAHIRV